jgi:hypothetical protein
VGVGVGALGRAPVYFVTPDRAFSVGMSLIESSLMLAANQKKTERKYPFDDFFESKDVDTIMGKFNAHIQNEILSDSILYFNLESEINEDDDEDDDEDNNDDDDEDEDDDEDDDDDEDNNDE